MMILINSGWITKRSEISGVDMVGGGRGFWYVQTLNILLQKVSNAPNPFGSRKANNL